MIEILILKRILLALLLGAIIGFERERAHKVAGLRTHVLVCISSALITLVALYGFADAGATFSPSHIIANIILGIGFIGGGTIMRADTKVSGTTTAASLWTVAAVGMSAGAGFAFAAILVTLISYLILTFFWRIETNIAGSNHEGEDRATDIRANP